MSRKLIWRLYPTYLLVTILAMVSVTWYAANYFRQVYLNQTSEELYSHAKIISQQVSSAMQAGTVDQLCKELGQISKTRITVIDSSGKVLGDTDSDPSHMVNHSDRPEFRQAMESGSGKSVRFSATIGKNMMYVAVPLKTDEKKVVIVRVSKPVTAIEKALKDVYMNIFWAAMVTAGCIAAISLLIARQISRPIAMINETAQRFAKGDLEQRVPVPATKELRSLAKTLNQMATQLTEKVKAVTRQRNELEAVLSSMSEGVIAVDKTGRIMSVNRAAASLLDINTEAIHGRSVEEVIRNPDLQQFIYKTIEGEMTLETEISLVTGGESTPRFFQLHGANLSLVNGGEEGAVIVVSDMTRMRKLEAIRRDFVANVSHELRTPITSIKGSAETLLDGAINDSEQGRRFVEIIARHTDRLSTLIEDLLCLSMLDEGSEKGKITLLRSAIRPVLVSAAELSKGRAQEKRIKIVLECDEKLEARMHSALLEQAVANLIDNAIKYSEPDKEVHVKAEPCDKEVTIAVADNGWGIEQKHLQRIFERFYVVDKSRSRKLGGTGLGLAIVKHIAQTHGGHVTVTSEIGKGSTFMIHLPNPF